MKRTVQYGIIVLTLMMVAPALPAEFEAPPANNLGIIFNTSSIQFDLESYQSGIGIKLRKGNVGTRVSADIYYSNAFSTFSFDTGATLEYYLRQARVSPYIGGFLRVGLTAQSTKTDEDNWTRDTNIPAAGGGVLGAEVFITEFLSVFGEYSATAELLVSVAQTSTAGSLTSAQTYSLLFDLKIGNDAMLGIVLYLK